MKQTACVAPVACDSRDVRERALVEQRLAVRVAHGAGVLEHHEPGAVLALQHQLGVADFAVLGHAADPVVAVPRVGVHVLRDVHGQQLVLRVVAEHAHQRRIGCHELAVARGLEHAGGDVLEQFAVALLGRLERLEGVSTLGGIAQHLVHELRGDVAAHEVIERAAVHGLLAQVLVLLGDQRHDRDAGRLRLQAQERGHAEAVGQVQVEQHRIDMPGLDRRQRVGERTDGLQAVRLPADALDGRPDGRMVRGFSADEQDVGLAHVPPSIGRVGAAGL
jgi:hypothetical protein